MSKFILFVLVIILTGCMMPDYPDAPRLQKDDTAGNIEVLQVIDNDEILAYYKNKLGHFTIENMKPDIIDDGVYSVKGVKQVGVYRYTSAWGTVKTVPDYTIDNDMGLDAKYKEELEKYDINFPKEERKNYQSLFCEGFATIIYTPFSILFSPICLLNKDYYSTTYCLSNQEINTPYKDRK